MAKSIGIMDQAVKAMAERQGKYLPETQYGVVVNWGFFDNTNLALEYLHGEFQNDFQTTDTFTAQLAVEF